MAKKERFKHVLVCESVDGADNIPLERKYYKSKNGFQFILVSDEESKELARDKQIKVSGFGWEVSIKFMD